MSSSTADPTKDASTEVAAAAVTESPKDKGKGKAPTADDAMDEDESSSSEDDDDDDEEDDSDEEEDDLQEIDPTAIVGRRTRGVKVDYTSAAALEKAGLKQGEDDDDEDKMKD